MVGYAECPVNIDYLRTILGRALVSIGKIIESPISIHFQVRWFSLCDCVRFTGTSLAVHQVHMTGQD